MKKRVFTQVELDKLVVAERRVVMPTILGVGCNDVLFKIYVGNTICWQYGLWKAMLARCFNEGVKRRQPTYKDVTCCNEWLSFANFFEWVNKEVDYKGKPCGLDLDKDLLVSGSRIYSPSTCSFVPTIINRFLTGCYGGDCPAGVFFDTRAGKFVARLRQGNKRKHLGLFSTPEDAFAVYKIAKEAQIKVVALRYRDVIKPAVFDLLMGWEVD